MSEERFFDFITTQVETIRRFIEELREQGDTRDDDTLALVWIERHAAAFRSAWRPRSF